MPTHVARGLVLLVLASPLALGQAQQPASDPPVEPAEEPALGGPKVVQAAPARPTIVEFDFNGEIKPPDSSPEEAAVGLLQLDDATKAKVHHVFSRRAQIVEDLIADNIPLVTQLDTAGKTGDKMDLAALLWQLFVKSAPLREGGPLDKQVRDLLPPKDAAEFDRILNAYWDAVWQSKRGRLNKDGQKYNRVGAVIEAKFESLGKEAERAFKRLETSGELAYRYLFTGIVLRDDQRLKVRDLIQRHTEVTKGSPTEAQNRAVFLLIMQVLDEKQQRQLVKNIQGITGK